jgi:hypothetical protein
MSTVYLLDPSSTLATHIVTKTGSKMSIGDQSLPSAPNAAGDIVLNVQGPTSTNNVSAFQIPADTSNNRPTTNYAGYIRYNTTNNAIEYWNALTSSWQSISADPPAIASVSPSFVTDQAGGNSITILGSNFVATPSVVFIDNQNLNTPASSVTFNSSSSLTAIFPNSLIDVSGGTLGPYSVEVTNLSSGLSATSFNAINVNLTPYWSPSNSVGSPTVLGPVDGSVNLTKASNIRCIAIDPETIDLSYSLTSDTSQNLVPANVTLDVSGYLISTSTPRLVSATSYSFQVYARERTTTGLTSAIGYFNLSVNSYYPLLSFSALSGLTVTIGYVDNNGLNYRTTGGPYTASPPGYTIYTIQCTNSTSTSAVVGAYTVTKGGTTGTGTVTYPTTVNGGCPSFLTCFILAGGGGGGGNQAGSGGGAGGLLYNQCYPINALAGTSVNIQVGQGGTSAAETAMNAGINGGAGADSFLGSNIALGGAGGMTMSLSNNIVAGTSGGSGSGGSAWTTTGSTGAGGSGANQLTITSQGNAGGSANNVVFSGSTVGHSSGGGGGAAGPGTNTYPKAPGGGSSTTFTVMNSGWGGNGIATNINGQTQLQVAGGGGGGCYYGTAGNGGVGGGGAGLSNTSTNGSAGTPATDKNGAANTGGGGGGGGIGGAVTIAGNGGCGIMILRHVSYIAPAVLNTYTITSSILLTTTTIFLNNAGSPINSGAGPAVNGGYTVLVFTSTGNGNTGTCTFTPTTNIGPNVSYLVCAGGGSGGQGGGGGAGGGGGGGVLVGTAFPVSINTGYSIQVGKGGSAIIGVGPSGSGSNSTFGTTITAVGGGGGGSQSNLPSGGSGGGGGEFPNYLGGLGTIGQGFNGGSTVQVGIAAGAGGAGGQGVSSTASTVGAGGPGLPSTITGTLIYYGGGGGASGNDRAGSAAGSCGPSPFTSAGNGGPGSGGSGTPTSGINGFGGGGGGTYQVGQGTLTGGGGTVILRFPSYTMS